MRVPRKLILPPEFIFHFMWRCINGEFMLPDMIQIGCRTNLVTILLRRSCCDGTIQPKPRRNR